MGTDKDKGKLGERFESFEYKPTKDSWDRIAGKLDDKPGVLGPKFKGFEHAPNVGVWAGIERRLNAKRVAYWKWTGAAVLGLLMLGSAGWMMGLFEQEPSGNAPGSGFVQPGTESVAPVENSAAPVGKGSALALNTNPKSTQKLFSSRDLKRNSLFTRPQYGLGNLFVPGLGPKHKPVAENGSKEIPVAEDKEVHSSYLADQVQLEEGVSSQANDSILKAPAKPVQQVQPQEEYFPEIEFPKGDEAEGGLSFNLGANLSSGGSLAFTDNQAMMEGDVLNLGFGSSNALQDYAVENYSTPFMVGAGISIPLFDRIFLQPGINYTLLRSENTNDGTRFARHYLGLNLNGNVLIIKRDRFGAYLQAGAQADAGLGVDVDPGNSSIASYTGMEAGNQVSLMAGGGVHYMLTKHLGFYLQAMATHYVYQSRSNLWTQRTVWPMAQVGLKVQL